MKNSKMISKSKELSNIIFYQCGNTGIIRKSETMINLVKTVGLEFFFKIDLKLYFMLAVSTVCSVYILPIHIESWTVGFSFDIERIVSLYLAFVSPRKMRFLDLSLFWKLLVLFEHILCFSIRLFGITSKEYFQFDL